MASRWPLKGSQDASEGSSEEFLKVSWTEFGEGAKGARGSTLPGRLKIPGASTRGTMHLLFGSSEFATVARTGGSRSPRLGSSEFWGGTLGATGARLDPYLRSARAPRSFLLHWRDRGLP